MITAGDVPDAEGCGVRITIRTDSPGVIDP